MKNYLKNILYIPMCAAILHGCTMDVMPVAYSNAPAFGIVGTLNNAPIKIEAGSDGYHLFTKKDYGTDSVYTFTSTLRPANPATTAANITIQLRDNQLRQPTEPINISAVAQPQTYYYKNNSSNAANGSLLKFIAEPTGLPPFTYAWNFGDGTASANAIATHTFIHSGNYQVQLVVRDAQNRVQNLSNPVFVPPNYTVCTAHFNHVRTADKSYNFGAIITPDMRPNTIHWDMGDGTIYNNQQYFVAHSYRESGVYHVTMTMTLTNATDTTAAPCTVSVSKRIVTDGINATGLGFNYLSGYTPTRHNLSTIAIEYTDKNGEIYTSINGLQPQWSNFEIQNTEPYIPNEQGQATQKITAKVACRLFGNNSHIDLKNAEVRFAVAY